MVRVIERQGMNLHSDVAQSAVHDETWLRVVNPMFLQERDLSAVRFGAYEFRRLELYAPPQHVLAAEEPRFGRRDGETG